MSLGVLKFDRKPGGVTGAGNPPTESHKYVAAGTLDGSVVDDLAIAGTASIILTAYGTLYRQDIRKTEVGHGIWNVEVPYATQKQVTGEFSWNFDTTGATVKIRAAREHVASYENGGVVGGVHKGAINVNGDDVEGVDIVIPSMKLSVAFRHPMGVVTIPFAKHLHDITGRYNDDRFMTFDPGELLFLGGSGSDGTVAEAEVTYQFAGSPNDGNLTIGEIANIVKKGHDYAWVEFADNVDGGDSGRKPKVVHVERVYQTMSFVTNFGNWG